MKTGAAFSARLVSATWEGRLPKNLDAFPVTESRSLETLTGAHTTGVEEKMIRAKVPTINLMCMRVVERDIKLVLEGKGFDRK